jgi:hypothetical protein
MPPTWRRLERASAAIAKRWPTGPVLVCCALGFSRAVRWSVAAWLLRSGAANDRLKPSRWCEAAGQSVVLGATRSISWQPAGSQQYPGATVDGAAVPDPDDERPAPAGLPDEAWRLTAGIAAVLIASLIVGRLLRIVVARRQAHPLIDNLNRRITAGG